MAIELHEKVRHNGEIFLSGEIIEKIEKVEAKRLVSLGVASFVREIPSLSPNENKDSDEDIPLSRDTDDDYKALDEDYTHEELKEMALTVDGLEFKSNILKKDLIHLIIESGKVEAFFEEEA